MKRKIRQIILLSILIVCVLGLAGCGKKVADEEKIKQDLDVVLNNGYLSEGEKIDSIVVEKRQTEKKQKIDVVWCKIITSDETVSYEKEAVVTYGLYDKDGWIFDDVSVNDEDEWILTPLQGVSEDDVAEVLQGQTVMIDGESWYIENNIDKINIITQDTSLEQKQDKITADVSILSDVLIAHGEVQMTFKFDKKWDVESYEITTPFESGYQPDKQLIISEQDLISIITENPVLFMENTEEQQKINVSEAEIKNFIIDDNLVSDMGLANTYNCSFDLNKKGASFEVEVTIPYRYYMESGWEREEISYSTVSVKTVDFSVLEGTWEGQMSEFDVSNNTMQMAEWEIAEIADDGNVTMTINLPKENRSCILVGYVDSNNLGISLEFSEWIKKPARTAYIYEPKIQGILDVDNGTIKCIDQAYTNTFEMTKRDD